MLASHLIRSPLVLGTPFVSLKKCLEGLQLSTSTDTDFTIIEPLTKHPHLKSEPSSFNADYLSDVISEGSS